MNLNAFDLLTDFCDVAINNLVVLYDNGSLIPIVMSGSGLEKHYIAVMGGRARLIHAVSSVRSGVPFHAAHRAREMEAKFWSRFGKFVADSLSGGSASINRLFVDFGRKSLADVFHSMVSELGFDPDVLENRVRFEVQRSFEDSGIATGAEVVESVRAGLPAVIGKFRIDLSKDAPTSSAAVRSYKKSLAATILGIDGLMGVSDPAPVK